MYQNVWKPGFSGLSGTAYWDASNKMPPLNFYDPLTGSYTFLEALCPRPHYDSYNTVVEMIDCQIFLTG